MSKVPCLTRYLVMFNDITLGEHRNACEGWLFTMKRGTFLLSILSHSVCPCR